MRPLRGQGGLAISLPGGREEGERKKRTKNPANTCPHMHAWHGKQAPQILVFLRLKFFLLTSPMVLFVFPYQSVQRRNFFLLFLILTAFICLSICFFLSLSLWEFYYFSLSFWCSRVSSEFCSFPYPVTSFLVSCIIFFLVSRIFAILGPSKASR